MSFLQDSSLPNQSLSHIAINQATGDSSTRRKQRYHSCSTAGNYSRLSMINSLIFCKIIAIIVKSTRSTMLNSSMINKNMQWVTCQVLFNSYPLHQLLLLSATPYGLLIVVLLTIWLILLPYYQELLLQNHLLLNFGETISNTHKEDLQLSDSIILKDTICIPKFSVNLLLVSKLIKTLNCSVISHRSTAL